MGIFKTGAGRNLLDLAIIAAGFLVLLPVLGINRTTDFIIFCVFVLGFNLLYGFIGHMDHRPFIFAKYAVSIAEFPFHMFQ